MAAFTINPPNAPLGKIGGQSLILDPTWYRFFANLQRVLGNDVVSEIQRGSFITYDVSDVLVNERVLAGDTDIVVTVGPNIAGLSLSDTTVLPGTYGSTTQIPIVSFDSKGRATSASEVALNSDNVAEGSINLYYADALARSALSGGTGISYNSGTGAIAVNSVLAAYAGGDTPSAFTLGIVDAVDAAAWRTALGFADGTYTPTLSAPNNVASYSVGVCQYMRVGAVVTVSGNIEVDPISSATDTSFSMSLPIASNLSSSGQVGGTASAWNINQGIAIYGDTATDTAVFRYFPGSAVNGAFGFSFTYLVV